MDKIALITGVSRDMGLGYETAKQLSELRYKVIITARQRDKLEPLAEKSNFIAMTLDVTSDSNVNQVAADVQKQFGKLDILINNAGGFFDQGNEALSADIQYIKNAFDLNLLGAWRMVKAFLPLLKKSPAGRIVNVSSGAGSFSDPTFGLSNHQGNVPVYGITKLALNGLTVKLARELKNTTVKVNAVCPGFVATYPGTEQWEQGLLRREQRELCGRLHWTATVQAAAFSETDKC